MEGKGLMEGLKLGTTSLAAENGGTVTIHMTLIAAYVLAQRDHSGMSAGGPSERRMRGGTER